MWSRRVGCDVRTRSCLLANTRMALLRIRGSSMICCGRTTPGLNSLSLVRLVSTLRSTTGSLWSGLNCGRGAVGGSDEGSRRTTLSSVRCLAFSPGKQEKLRKWACNTATMATRWQGEESHLELRARLGNTVFV